MPVTYFWLVLLVFFSSIILFFKNWLARDIAQVIVFATGVTLFVGLYYIGDSRPEYLFPISLFVVLNYFLVMGGYVKRLDSIGKKTLVLCILSIVFVVWPTYIRKEFIADLIINKFNNLKSKNFLKSGFNEALNKKYNEEISLINQNIKDHKILIIYNDDTYLFYLLNKENLLHVNPMITITTKSELGFATYEAEKTCPKKIVVDCYLAGRCLPHFNTMINPVLFTVSVGRLILTKIETDCNIKYQPIICTNNLCIAQAQ
jgi:hypothetical protein